MKMAEFRVFRSPKSLDGLVLGVYLMPSVSLSEIRETGPVMAQSSRFLIASKRR